MDHVEIPLSRGLFAKVSHCDAALMSAYKWHAKPGRNTFYAATKLNGKTTYMHRLVLALNDGVIHVDHRDEDGLNNQRENLRPCTRGENARRRTSDRSAIGIRGVYLQRGKFVARIGHKGKFHYLGTFKSAAEASAAYAKAANELFGEFSPVAAV